MKAVKSWNANKIYKNLVNGKLYAVNETDGYKWINADDGAAIFIDIRDWMVFNG